MARKHRVQPDDLAALTEDLRGRLERLEAGEDGIALLEATVAAARADYDAAADILSQRRHAAAERLDAAVAGELAPLKLDAARFRTTVVSVGADGWSAHGKDRVEFEIATNPGAPFAPLAKIASGGELSRFILALKVEHLLIAKSHDGTVTRTGVRVLDEAERREEIARMLSGATVTDEARAQADRLLETA